MQPKDERGEELAALLSSPPSCPLTSKEDGQGPRGRKMQPASGDRVRVPRTPKAHEPRFYRYEPTSCPPNLAFQPRPTNPVFISRTDLVSPKAALKIISHANKKAQVLQGDRVRVPHARRNPTHPSPLRFWVSGPPLPRSQIRRSDPPPYPDPDHLHEKRGLPAHLVGVSPKYTEASQSLTVFFKYVALLDRVLGLLWLCHGVGHPSSSRMS